ncbi:hypothetical protein [Paenibacillus spongiae]|uniref:Uncharacterized protein n=1 Tax=Paenibacillus spongiae TaxID=2909671 RepID=A0ABY5S0S6_9BACL|nr:hypothetical protein [Paenibacillus spongiae]UVI27456.1 hypothetical protein L1F29_18470 [Paenibacillus spongiae]
MTKKRGIMLGVILMLLVMTTTPAYAGKNGNNEEQPLFTSQIGMWYTVWWDDESPFSSHWTDWTRYRPVIGDYSSGDADTIRAHMEWMKQAGVDFVILDDTNGHGNDNGNIAANIDSIFRVVESMPEGTAPKLALAIGYGQWGANDAAAHQAEADLIYHQYAQSPVYYHWKGKPLLVDYTTPFWFYKWDDERFTVRFATGKVSDGAPVAPETGLWGWVFDRDQNNEEVAGITPGWDTAHLGRGTTPIAREGGRLYTELWKNAVRSNPEAVIIASFNDHAEETGIEAVEPRDASAPAYLDYYGDPAPDWYQKLTEGYAGLKSGYKEGFYYKEEQKEQLYKFTNGELMKTDTLPHQLPVIELPEGYMNGKIKPVKPDKDEKENKWVAVDLYHSWLGYFRGMNQDWSFSTLLAGGTENAGLSNGSVFDYIQPTEIAHMYSQNEGAADKPADRLGFKVHPAWQGENGWVNIDVQTQLPQEKKLYLTYIPGKVNAASDGVSVTIFINGQQAAYDWIDGEAGWKPKRAVDISEYAGQQVTVRYKIGWGQEQLGDQATPAYDSFFIGEPRITTKM